jgi:hypothetical protein
MKNTSLLLSSTAVFLIATAAIAQAKRAAVPESLLGGKTQDDSPSTVKPAKGFSKVAGVSWADSDGSHYALFSTKFKESKAGRSSFLQVDIYDAKDAKSFKLNRSFKDKLENCEFDNSTGFVAQSIVLADADGNGKQELMFAYTVGCRSDVSPDDMKLFVIEGGVKNILRGQSRVKVSDTEFVGGDFKPAGFKNAPKLLDAAKQHWTALNAKATW